MPRTIILKWLFLTSPSQSLVMSNSSEIMNKSYYTDTKYELASLVCEKRIRNCFKFCLVRLAFDYREHSTFFPPVKSDPGHKVT